ALSLFALLSGHGNNANIWWIDLGWMPILLGWLLQFLVAVALLAFSLKVPRRLLSRVCAAGLFALFAYAALRNALDVFEAANSGRIVLGFPIPFSIFIMAAFLLLALAVLIGYRLLSGENHARPASRPTSRIATFTAAVVALLLCGLVFPLGQIICFGKTDYRTQVDVVVIFGAQVHPSGQPSLSLAGRLDMGIELYSLGYTPVLLMSGGTGVESYNEAMAMRQYALNYGIPPEAIIVDTQGSSTEMTVANTIEIAEENDFRRIGAVSSFYHMPRIKMYFSSQGINVSTTPADGIKEGQYAVKAALREIPAWWYYWFKMVLGV
ncbi:MAG: YdcF family protein, partial [Coriobacteriales bacterium]|nr:YdcF family protein [Coriobacteriales bacterium]